MTNEEYVRSVWNDVEFVGGDNSIIPGAGFVSADVMALTTIKSSPEQAWSAAAAFTRERLEEMGRFRQSIATLFALQLSLRGTDREAVQFAMDKLKATLDTLQTGMKVQP